MYVKKYKIVLAYKTDSYYMALCRDLIILIYIIQEAKWRAKAVLNTMVI